MTATVSVASIRNIRWPLWLSGPLVPALVALALGLIGIGDKSLWQDEAFSAATARLPTLDLISYLFHNELHASPHYLLINVWSALGTGEAQLRLLSVVVGVIGVVATYYVGVRYGVAFLAALLLAMSPLFVQFEQNVREYTMLVAAASISTLAYLRYIELPTRLRAAVYIVCAAVIIYVQPVGAFLIGAHAIWEFLRAPRTNRLRRLAVFVPIAISWLPMLRFMLLHRDKISWIPPLSDATISQTAISLAGGALALGAIAILVALRAKRDLITLWLVVPIAATLIVSALVQPMLQARYLILILPAVALIVARNRKLAVAMLVLIWSVGVIGWYRSPSLEDWRSADAWLKSASAPGDGIVVLPTFTRLPLEYYGAVGEPLYPVLDWSSPALPGRLQQGPVRAEFDNPRIWLVERNLSTVPPDFAARLADYNATETRSYGSGSTTVTVTLLTRRNDT